MKRYDIRGDYFFWAEASRLFPVTVEVIEIGDKDYPLLHVSERANKDILSSLKTGIKEGMLYPRDEASSRV